MTRKIDQPVTLFAQIEAAQHEKLRALAFQDGRSLADLVRDALDKYLAGRRLNARRFAIHEERVEVKVPPGRRKVVAR